MIETLMRIFMALLLILGCVVSIILLISIIYTTFIETKRKKKALDELKTIAEQCMKEIVDAEKAKKQPIKKPRKTKKSEEK